MPGESEARKMAATSSRLEHERWVSLNTDLATVTTQMVYQVRWKQIFMCIHVLER